MAMDKSPVASRLARARSCKDRLSMKPYAFYFGQLINFCGVILFFVGITSDAWVTLRSLSDKLPENKKLKLVARYGPWVACTQDGFCDDPWVILAGVDEVSTRMVQMMMAVTSVFYVSGLAVMMLQSVFPKTVVRRLWHSLDNLIIVEFIVPTGAVTGFLSMLLMGELKRKVILFGHQIERADYGFFITMGAILLTITGSLCMILNRYAVEESRIAYSKIKWRRLTRSARRQQRRNVSGNSANVVLRVSGVEIFVTDTSTEDSMGFSTNGQGTQNDDRGGRGDTSVGALDFTERMIQGGN